MRFLLSGSFFLFICWIIYLADTGQSSLFFQLVRSIPYGDKIGHAVLYGVLTLLLNISLKYQTIPLLFCRVQAGSLSVLIFAVIEELTQWALPNRAFDLADILADLVGIVLFDIISRVLKWRASGALLIRE